MCDYEGYEFGGGYLDSTCIDGYLWDMDSSDEEGMLSSGGDIPCPKCNSKAFLDYVKECVGYGAGPENNNKEIFIAALKKVKSLNPQQCSEWVEENRFVSIMKLRTDDEIVRTSELAP